MNTELKIVFGYFLRRDNPGVSFILMLPKKSVQ
jgi:hypothetical protein